MHDEARVTHKFLGRAGIYTYLQIRKTQFLVIQCLLEHVIH